LDEIATFVQKEASYGFLNLLFTKDQRISRIEDYYGRLSISIESFRASYHIYFNQSADQQRDPQSQISALVNSWAWQERNDNARSADQQALDQLLLDLDTNQQQLMDMLGKPDEQIFRYLTESTVSRY
jgi:hypothetical protein